jgi:hypothetical protein
VELARDFWKDAGLAEVFPRDLRRAAARALPLGLVSLSGLWLDGVRDWLRRQGLPGLCGGGDRPLRACLVAYRGQGLVFLDAADPEDEQRFSLAHEVAHFLRDYRQPRLLACVRLGGRAAEVLDGERPPTADECLDAVLARVPLGFHMHLMDRDAAGRFATTAIAAAERDADRLAYELLAPAESVRARTGGGADRDTVGRALQEVYGLPPARAVEYAGILLPAEAPADPLLRRLGLLP